MTQEPNSKKSNKLSIFIIVFAAVITYQIAGSLSRAFGPEESTEDTQHNIEKDSSYIAPEAAPIKSPSSDPS